MDRKEAFQIVRMIARGEDPYTQTEQSRNRPENNPETIQALCMVLAELMESDGNGTANSQDRRTSGKESSLGYLRGHSLGDYLNGLEKDAILEALEQTGFNKTRAAELLGLTFRQLRYKMDVHNLPRTKIHLKSAVSR